MPSLRLRSAFVLLVGFLFLYLLVLSPLSSHWNRSHRHKSARPLPGWGIADRIYVISLPGRVDRRAALMPLWKAHKLECIQYVDATGVKDPEVDRIFAHVRHRRRRTDRQSGKSLAAGTRSPRRPSFKDGLGKHPEELWGSDLWTLDSSLPDQEGLTGLDTQPLLCERGNPFNPHKSALDSQYGAVPTEITLHKAPILSRAMVACWHSHVRVIRQIAMLRFSPNETYEREPTYLVLEDDIDFEWNIKSFLVPIWNALPDDWDIVMLGHCWSDERFHPPIFELGGKLSPNIAQMNISLHPSNSPLCTHAYAISSRGATRLYNLLRHPTFAYSRALDQAIAWLIRSRNLKGAYSIVPSLVIQTKDSESDISERQGGSRWRDTLMSSTRKHLRMTAGDNETQ